MQDLSAVIPRSSGDRLSIRVDGPPHFDGGRIVVDGSPAAFRMLAQVLLAMAETVEADPTIRNVGWGLVLGPEEMPQLQMEDGYRLSLDCAPGESDSTR